MTNKVILVTGATGQQGGAAAKHLMQDGWKLRALVRDPQKASAQQLEKQGVELFKGDLNDRTSLDQALQGVYGAFAVTNFWLPDVGFDGEIKQGKNLADAALAAEIDHFVYSSVGAAHRGMGQQHFESKWLVEQHIHEIGLPATILRPVAFMNNLEWNRPAISNGSFPSWGTRADKRTQLIAVDDIGALTAVVFGDRDKFLGQTLEIAGDELTEGEQAQILSKVIGRPVEVTLPNMEEGAAPNEETLAMIKFFNGKAYTADIAAVRDIYPGLQNFEQYLLHNGWKDLPVIPMSDDGSGWG